MSNLIHLLKHPSGQWQHLAVADLTTGTGVEIFRALVQESPVPLVYSDPPWSPGNEKWWRRYAGESPPESYSKFLGGWVAAAASCNPEHVFVEQSIRAEHRDYLTQAINRCPSWNIPYQEAWRTYYGSPARPNMLLHYGCAPLATNPADLKGVKMTREVFKGLSTYPQGTVVADPCMGLGMTSRLAHERGWNCIGTELNPARLQKTIDWLLRKGYAK